MAKDKVKTKVTPLQWAIRCLVVAIFAVTLVIAASRLMEWNKNRQRLEELERQKQELQEELGTNDEATGEGQAD